MSENGRLPKSDLAPIPGGELRKDAAAAWNAPGGPAAAGLVPTGPMSSYRTYDEQVYLYRLYKEGKGNLAAVPGTSNHGWGIAVDLREPWMRAWLDAHGAAFGWAKTEAPSEWWHMNFVGGVSFPTFVTLKRGSRGKRVLRATRRLAFVRRPHGRSYLRRGRRRFGAGVEKAVRAFQRDQGLAIDGQIGPKTAARLNAVFHRQYQARHSANPKGASK